MHPTPTFAGYKERFFWSWEKVEESVSHIGVNARVLMVALAQAAPDEQSAFAIAAGPLENYINLIVKKRATDEAAFIVGNEYLKPLLSGVWGDIQKLEPLAKLSARANLSDDLRVETGLQILTLKEVAAFWCQMCVSSIVTNYQETYEQVMEKLFNKNTREQAKHDLLLSAPDEEAKKYLESNIFVLHNDLI